MRSLHHIFFRLILGLLLLSITAQAQETLEMMRLEYQNFNYRNVISLSDAILLNKERLQQNELKELWQLRGMSHYALQNLDHAMADFLELLRLDPAHTLDASRTSPKIIQFFSELKNQVQPVPEPAAALTPHDTVLVDQSRPVAAALRRSLAAPGWGHCYLGEKTKGRILLISNLTLFSVALISSADCHKKECAYLKNVDQTQMNHYYQRYDEAYKIRNAFWTAFAATWLFSQFDLLFGPAHHSAAAALQFQPVIDARGTPALFCSFSF